MTPRRHAPNLLRVATWNVNSLRVRLIGLQRLLGRTNPDVICLQETRGAAVSDDTTNGLARLGYEIAHVGTGGSNGVAIVSRHAIHDVVTSGDFGVEVLDREPRVIAAVVDTPIEARFVSIYVPHGRTVDHWHYDYKLAFLDALAGRATTWLGDRHLVIAGDLNIAPTDSDVFHPDAFRNSTHVTPSERAAWRALLSTGLTDVDAARWGPRSRRFTWWKPGLGYARNLGMRIDVITANHELAAALDTTWIDHEERGGERPSDHAALLADFHLRPSVLASSSTVRSGTRGGA
jgi:exodeoxyribonuclease III